MGVLSNLTAASAIVIIAAVAGCGAVSTHLDRANPVGDDPVSSVSALIGRVMGPQYIPRFKLVIISADNGTNDVFQIDSVGGMIQISGNTGVSLASGVNWYLKYSCNASVNWGWGDSGRQMKLPEPAALPTPVSTRIVSMVKYRYYMNVCTVSYSMAFWNWTRWEQHLDWMALNGINMPLSFAGQELVWYNFYKGLGMTESEIQAYFSGAAFLAWQRMGNIQGWGGPLSADWQKQQFDLQIQFLNRTRSFGMINALPGFSGHVPSAVLRLYPGINVTRSHQWGRFNATYSEDYMLEPTDQHYQTLGQAYYKMLIATFGTDHVYQTDLYNEMEPRSNESSYLTASNKAVYTAMATVDPEAIYLMQAWLFHEDFWGSAQVEAYLAGVPNNGMIILDLNTESSPVWSKFNNFFGKNWIWNMLHNYGGRRGIYGHLDVIASQPFADKATAGDSMVGTGLTPEAIENNPVMYEMMIEVAWHSQPIDVAEWVSAYVTRRYGGWSESVQAAWTILIQGCYSRSEDVASIELSPAIGTKMGHNTNATSVLEAWKLLQYAVDNSELEMTDPLHYDLLDVARQALINLFDDVHTLWEFRFQMWQLKNLNSSASVVPLGDKMLEILQDLDLILGTDVNFLLGVWIDSAKSWGKTPEEIKNLEFNARNQITLWGPDGNINDYAAKHWNGLVGTYYYPRWKLLVDMAHESVVSGVHINLNDYGHKLVALQWAWNIDTTTQFPSTPSGSLVDISLTLLHKYTESTSDYEVFHQSDVGGDDIGQMWTKDVQQLKWLCDLDPQCGGFNSNGYLKGTPLSGKKVAVSTFYQKA